MLLLAASARAAAGFRLFSPTFGLAFDIPCKSIKILATLVLGKLPGTPYLIKRRLLVPGS